MTQAKQPSSPQAQRLGSSSAGGHTLDTEQLERVIDVHGLCHVLTALECICGEKAEHIRANWQDRATARPWDTLSRRLSKLARESAEMLP